MLFVSRRSTNTMKTRREFLTAALLAPFAAKLKLPPATKKVPTVKALQAIADGFIAPRIERDVQFHVPDCSRFRTRVYPDPARPGYLFKTTWMYQGFRMAYSSAYLDPADFEKNGVEGIVGAIDAVRSIMSLKAIDFMQTSKD
jgi:hypothetical protein